MSVLYWLLKKSAVCLSYLISKNMQIVFLFMCLFFCEGIIDVSAPNDSMWTFHK